MCQGALLDAFISLENGLFLQYPILVFSRGEWPYDQTFIDSTTYLVISASAEEVIEGFLQDKHSLVLTFSQCIRPHLRH